MSCDDEDGPVALCKGRFAVERADTVVAAAAYNVSGGRSRNLLAPFAEGGEQALGDVPVRVRLRFGRYALETVL